MTRRFPAWLLLAIAIAAAPSCRSTDSAAALRERAVNPAVGRRIAVATVNPYATAAALDAYRRGGNAVDAAVAAAVTLGVVDPHNSGLGGGCFIVVRLADGRAFAIDGRETAPLASTADMFHGPDGKSDPALSQTGPLAVGTPGALAAYDAALRHAGRLELAPILRRAADLADEGFVVDAVLAQRLDATADDLRRFPAAAAIYLKPDGSPYREGDTLRNGDLAATYRAIADDGVDWFYRGDFARNLDAWMKEHGGRLAARDLAEYEPLFRLPVASSYRGHRIVGFPPPSSGGVHVAQILNTLERFDLRSMHEQSPARFVHVVAEAQKLAFADRAHWLGDPAFAEVPLGLLDRGYAATLADRIDPDRAIDVPTHGEPPRWQSEHFRHTTHIAAADDKGNVVAITATINTSFGAKVVVPGTGLVLNNEMDDFALAPGVPNAFGLVGAEANKVEPGKRPLSSMSPTIVFDPEGRPVLALGAAGGPRIITQVVETIVRHIDLGMPIDEALAAPRFHHQWKPDTLFVEPTMPADVQRELTRLGHKVEPAPFTGVTQAITIEKDGTMRAAHDPRVPGSAAAR